MTGTRVVMAGLAVGLFALAAPSALAQRQNGAGRMYDPNTEVTLTGTVTEVQSMPAQGARNMPGRGRMGMMMGGVHLTLKTDAGATVDVRLGPAAYLKEKQFEIAAGDALQVIGSRITMGGGDVVVAREVRKGATSLTLRDATGRPMWAGGPPR